MQKQSLIDGYIRRVLLVLIIIWVPASALAGVSSSVRRDDGCTNGSSSSSSDSLFGLTSYFSESKMAGLFPTTARNQFLNSSQAPSIVPCTEPRFRGVRQYPLTVDYQATVASADFNNDGRLDLLTLPRGGTPSILLGTGSNGGFTAPMELAPGLGAYSAGIGDFNEDGKLDILFMGSLAVEIHRGVGDGTFQLMTTINRTDNYFFTYSAVGDFNRDGHLDFAVTNSGYYPGSTYIYSGNGSGGFALINTLVFPSFEHGPIYVADLNEDSKPDLIVTQLSFENLIIMQGNGNGGFSQTLTLPIYGFNLKVLDFNGDGHLDLISITNVIFVSLGSGTGQFDPPIRYSPGWQVRGGDIADFNGDGKFDLAVSLSSSVPFLGQIQVLLGDGLGGWGVPTSYTTYTAPTGLRAADFNNDNEPDIAVVSYGYPSHMHILLNSCNDTSPVISIGGNVFDEDGYPVTATITLTSSEIGLLSALQDNNGNFIITDLPLGVTYTLTITDPFYFFSPSSVTFTNPTTNQFVSIGATLRKFRLTGHIGENATGQGFANLLVRLIGPYDTDQTTYTDSSGTFIINELKASSEPYTIILTPNPVAFFSSYTYDIIIYGDRQIIIGGYRYYYSLTCQVLSNNGTPIPYVPLFLQSPSRSGITDTNGQLTFINLGAGFRYTITTGRVNLHFTPPAAVMDYLTGNQTVTLRAELLVPSDFDGDGKTDLGVFRPGNGAWYIQHSSDSQYQESFFGLSSDIEAPADYDGDQKTDIAVFRPSDGMWYLLLSATGTYRAESFGMDGDIPVPADFDREGKADLAIFRPSTGTWYIWLSYYNTLRSVQWGTNGDKPLTGDFDGDTYNDYAVFRPSTGTWYIRTANDAVNVVQFGLSSDKALLGDYDGDTRSDLCVWRPATGTWYVLQSSNSSLQAAQFGIASDIPLAGDFDGDGKTDFSVFRPTQGTWYTLKSSDGLLLANHWGIEGDRPIAAAFTR